MLPSTGSRSRSRRTVRTALAALLLALPGILAAQTDESTAQEAARQLTPAGVASWADTTFGAALEAHRISGAVVSVVQDGAIVLERGYGVGDVLSGAAADPQATRVRIGSTTKTFTATLLAELVEAGRIASLDDPVNPYLQRLQLPDNNGVPITLRHLLTHTAGFEDRFYHIGAIDPVTVPATPAMIESLRPDYARPAGEHVVYSNFGVALVGWLIEDLSGEPIARTMSAQLFAPLGMTQTELVVDVAEPSRLAVPGVLDAGGMVGPTPFTAINPAVAQTGSIVSTAHDMALYMNAQLGESGLIAPGVIQRLETPLARNAEGISELGMVYFLDRWAGQRMVSHGGNWAGFHTWMLLLPDQRSGLFISLLSEAAPNGLVDRFLAATFPALAPPPSPAALSAAGFIDQFMLEFFGPKRSLDAVIDLPPDGLDAFTGLYRADRRPFSTTEALSSLVYFGGDVVEVTAGEKGLFLGGGGPWLPEGDGSFVLDAPTRPRMVFSTDSAGRMVLAPDIGIYTFTRISALANPKWQAITIHLLLPLTLLGLLAARGLRRNPHQWAPFAVAVAGVVLVACAVAGLPPGDTLMNGYFTGRPARMLVFVAAANLQLLATLATLVFANRAGAVGRQRALQLALALLGLAVAALLLPYNIIGFHRI